MKNLLLIGIACLMFISSCKKKEDDPAPKTTKEQITQFWNIDNISLTEYNLSDGSVSSSNTVDGKAGKYFLNIVSDYTYSVKVGSSIEFGTWSLPDDKTLVLDGTDSYDIELLNNSNLTLSQTEYTSTKKKIGKMQLFK